MEIRGEKGMTLIVKTVTRLTLGFILLYGIYISLNGHISPGGGFAGGVIVALSFVHLMLAFGKDAAFKRFSPGALRISVSVSALIFLYVVMSGSPSRIFDEEVILPLCETVVVGGGLFAIFIALVLLSKSDKDSE
ncbi:MAG: MnhB domain-containing protein [Candidatus Omnitrophota bacterium]